MKCLLLLICLYPVISLATTKTAAENSPTYYSTGLCNYPQYQCIKVARRQSWERLFPDKIQRDLVQRLNRTYNRLWPGKIIVIPKNLTTINLFDISPFKLRIEPSDDKQIIVDQEKLAWAAYDEQGQLVKWGPISSGSDKCSDSDNSCRTLTGIFRIFSKESVHCISNAFPAGRGGAKMPYCMFFHKGFALHGSDDIPGYRASHGCIRMFIQDAKWLNESFVTTSAKENRFSGTVVVVRPLN